MKKGLRVLSIFIVFMFVTFMMEDIESEAADENKLINLSDELFNSEDEAVTIGSYYFKRSSRMVDGITDYSCVQVSYDGYTYYDVPFSIYSVTDGNVVYYGNSDNASLYVYDLYTDTSRRLKKIPALKNASNLSDVEYQIYTYNDTMLMVCESSWYSRKVDTYFYNINTKKLKYNLSNLNVEKHTKKYALVKESFVTDYEKTYSLYIYKYVPLGLKKVKCLSKSAYNYEICGKYIYYSVRSYKGKNNSSRVTLYRCKWDGTGKKKIREFKSYWPLKNITSKYCEYENYNGTHYRYYYKTGKSKRV